MGGWGVGGGGVGVEILTDKRSQKKLGVSLWDTARCSEAMTGAGGDLLGRINGRIDPHRPLITVG